MSEPERRLEISETTWIKILADSAAYGFLRGYLSCMTYTNDDELAKEIEVGLKEAEEYGKLRASKWCKKEGE